MRLIQVVLVVTFLSYLDGQRYEISRFNFFDTDLFRYAAEEKIGNVVISPASIKSTLAMLLEGAGGVTEMEIRRALRLSPDKSEFREQLNLYLLALQSNSTNGILQNANAIFVSEKLKLRKEYEMMLLKAYMTEIRKVNFKDSFPAANFINEWVKNKTMGLIPSILEPVHVGPTTDVLLVNTLYFKSSWQHAFDARGTRSGCFYYNGVCRTVAMMELQAELNYAYVDNLRSHAIELPYQGGRYSMILLVPQEREGLVSLIRDLPYMSLPQISQLFELTDVTLMLPRFTIDYNEDMIRALKAMGINTLFSSNANLTGIFESDTPLVNNIFHRVYISVDETGTVAAAATAGMVIPLMHNGVQLRVDRPFAFFIRDNSHGLILFEGKIEAPTAFVDHNSGQLTKESTRTPTKRAFD